MPSPPATRWSRWSGPGSWTGSVSSGPASSSDSGWSHPGNARDSVWDSSPQTSQNPSPTRCCDRRLRRRPTREVRTIATVRPIVRYGADVLGTPCATVTTFDDALATLVEDMVASMHAADGVGLAANQIGVGLRVFVLDCPDDREENVVGHIVNPELVHTEHRELDIDDEACLSLPGCSGEVPRLLKAAVTGVDVTGAAIRIDGEGLAARCLQHEVDHLDGLLYADRLSTRKRKATLRAHRRWLEHQDDLGVIEAAQ